MFELVEKWYMFGMPCMFLEPHSAKIQTAISAELEPKCRHTRSRNVNDTIGPANNDAVERINGAKGNHSRNSFCLDCPQSRSILSGNQLHEVTELT